MDVPSVPSLSLQNSLPSPFPWGEVFQITTYRKTTVNEIVTAIKELVESETNKKVNIVWGSPRLGDVRRNHSEISKAKVVLGYEPEYHLRESLAPLYVISWRAQANGGI